LYSFASIYSRHYYSIYRVCVCIWLCWTPSQSSWKSLFELNYL
jgi:hypothetical protein